jgi:hypothetical protein
MKSISMEGKDTWKVEVLREELLFYYYVGNKEFYF